MKPEEITARDIRNIKPTNCSILGCYWELNITDGRLTTEAVIVD